MCKNETVPSCRLMMRIKDNKEPFMDVSFPNEPIYDEEYDDPIPPLQCTAFWKGPVTVRTKNRVLQIPSN